MKSAISILLLVLGLACLWGAARVHESLLEWRTERGRETAVSLDRSPPLVVFTTVALGGFRGIIADLLWIRAIRLQEEGNVFELTQLADWITKLEPRFITVWAFNAWNLAYNISDRFPDPEDRWRWVNNGIRLLRDEGLKYNPNSADLHRELGWMYQHKIGHYLDPAHPAYKWKLVQDMASLFDGSRPDYSAALRDPRLIRMKDEFKLDPAVMAAIDRDYGPLDWRLPATHALYWAYRGCRVAVTPRSALGCDHMLCQCMAESFRHGRLILDARTGLYLTVPDLELLPRVIKMYQESMRRHPGEATLRLSYANFLGEAAVILFAYGRIAEARDLYQQLTFQQPDPDAALSFDDFMLQSLNLSIRATPLRDAVALIEGFLVQSYVRAARGEEDRAVAFERLADLIWTRLVETSGTTGTVDQWQRAGLAPFDEMRRQAYRRAMSETPETAP